VVVCARVSNGMVMGVDGRVVVVGTNMALRGLESRVGMVVPLYV
jgi:hypothetical protein